MKKIGKYEFDSLQQAEEKITALGVATNDEGNEYPTHKHCVVKLGNIVITKGEYDSEGNETAAPVLSDKYHLDVLWKGLEGAEIIEDGEVVGHEDPTQPEGWAEHAVDVTDNGVHAFMGLEYNDYKF